LIDSRKRSRRHQEINVDCERISEAPAFSMVGAVQNVSYVSVVAAENGNAAWLSQTWVSNHGMVPMPRNAFAKIGVVSYHGRVEFEHQLERIRVAAANQHQPHRC
jgi:hypothetical protein